MHIATLYLAVAAVLLLQPSSDPQLDPPSTRPSGLEAQEHPADDETVRAILGQFLSPATPGEERGHYGRLAVEYRAARIEGGVEALIAGLSGEDRAVRILSALALSHAPVSRQSDVLEAFDAHLSSDEVEDALLANMLRALSHFEVRSVRGADHLWNILLDKAAIRRVRVLAASALLALSPTRQTLDRMEKDLPDDVDIVIYGLGEFLEYQAKRLSLSRRARVKDFLLNQLASPEPDVRRVSLRALAYFLETARTNAFQGRSRCGVAHDGPPPAEECGRSRIYKARSVSIGDEQRGQ